MRVLIFHSARGVEAAAKALGKALENRGNQVQYLAAPEVGATTTALAYDLICVGSPVEGLFGGKVAADIAEAIPRLKRLEGKKTVAFVKPKVLGTEKALRKLMELLEREGANVFDFATIRGDQDASRLAKRI